MSEKKIEWKNIDGKEWCVDENNNKNSVSYWGSKEKAEKALISLKNCSGCSDCIGCSDKIGDIYENPELLTPQNPNSMNNN